MSQLLLGFTLGFLTAIALIAVTVIVWAVIAHRRQERQRQQGINAIIGKVASGAMSVNEARIVGIPEQLDFVANPQGKKGVH